MVVVGGSRLLDDSPLGAQPIGYLHRKHLYWWCWWWEELSGGQELKLTSFVRVHVLNSFSDFLFGNCQPSFWAILAVLHDRLRLRKSCFFRHVFMNFCLRSIIQYLNKTQFYVTWEPRQKIIANFYGGSTLFENSLKSFLFYCFDPPFLARKFRIVIFLSKNVTFATVYNANKTSNAP